MQHDSMKVFATPLYRVNLGSPFTDEELKFFRVALADCVESISNFSMRDKNVLNNPALRDLRLCR